MKIEINIWSDFPWLSILLCASSLISQTTLKYPENHQYEQEEWKEQQELKETKLKREDEMGIISCFPNSQGRISKAYVAEYLEMWIELFCCCLTIKEYKILGESTGLSALISLVTNYIDELRKVITYLETNQVHEEWSELVYELFPLLKGLQCIDVAVTSHPSHVSIWRENDFNNVLSLLFEVLSQSTSSLLLTPNCLLHDILLSCLNLLGSILSARRRRMVLSTESGVQMLHLPHFSTIFHFILTSKSTINQFTSSSSYSLPILQCLCELFYVVIEIEPQFLSHFIGTGLAELFIDTILIPIPTSTSFDNNKSIESNFLAPDPSLCEYVIWNL